MDQIASRVFKHKTAVPERLLAYGFVQRDGEWRYETDLLGGAFRLFVRIGTEIGCRLVDCETDEPYTLHLVESAEGSFVGEVRTAYEGVLAEIAKKCFVTEIFRSHISKQAIAYARERYGDELEFLWNDFSGAILRRKDTGKWYAVFMTVAKKRLGIVEGGDAEVIDLRMLPEELERRVDGKRILRGYHMNKKHWITVFTDGSTPSEELFRLIDASYALAVK